MPRLRDYFAIFAHAGQPWDARNAQRADVLLVCGDDDRGYIFAGTRYSQLTDSLGARLEAAGLSVATCSLPFTRATDAPAFGREFHADGLFARAALVDAISKAVARRGVWRTRTVDAWRGVLRGAGAKAVVGIQPPPELCAAARREGLWIADMQHGVVAGDPYYDQQRYGPAGGEAWPNCVLCWDAPSADTITARLGGTVRARVIGNPWLTRFASPLPKDRLVADALERFPLAPRTPGARVVLISLQWGLDQRPGYHPLGLPLPLIHVITQSPKTVEWWLRVHPIMMRGDRRTGFEDLLASTFAGRVNVAWEAPSLAPLPLVLSRASAHLTSHSAVTIEAAWFGVRTALLDSRKEIVGAFFSDQIARGSAELVMATEASIVDWLAHNLGGAQRSTVDANYESKVATFVDALRSYAIWDGSPDRMPC